MWRLYKIQICFRAVFLDLGIQPTQVNTVDGVLDPFSVAWTKKQKGKEGSVSSVLHAGLKHREVKRKVKIVGHRQSPEHPCVQWRESAGQNDSPGQNEACHRLAFSHGGSPMEGCGPRPELIQNFELCFPEWIKALKSWQIKKQTNKKNPMCF